MTLHYIAGELSLILGELEAAVPGPTDRSEVADLRHEAEMAPSLALPAVTERALRLTHEACWKSLTLGDADRFRREAAISAELWHFGVCAHLLDERTPAEVGLPGSADR